jgi:tRNA(Arg) A34 adenosine deaminase TadA
MNSTETTQHITFLNRCLEIANHSVKNGNHPFGAVIVVDGVIRLGQGNEVGTKQDVTAHAEILLIQKAQRVLTENELERSVLYSSTEPCAMCSGAIYWAGVKNVIYACKSSDLNLIVGGSLDITCKEVFDSGLHKTIVQHIPGLESFKKVHQDFW